MGPPIVKLCRSILCLSFRNEDEKFPDLEKEFEPNLINSTVYIISMALQVATFAINYKVVKMVLSISHNRRKLNIKLVVKDIQQ